MTFYSLGAMLYGLLAGRPAFQGSNFAEILRRTREGDFQPPRRVNPLVHPALEAVCLKAMASQPDARYPSPKILAEEIGQWMAEEPVSAWREPIVTRSRRWIRRHRTLVASAIVTLLSCVIGVGAMLVDLRIRATRRLADA